MHYVIVGSVESHLKSIEMVRHSRIRVALGQVNKNSKQFIQVGMPHAVIV